MRESRRGRTADTNTEESTVTEPTTDTQAETPATETAGTESAEKRAARPALEVGEVKARTSARTDLKSRPSPTESNPVFIAVRDAEFDTATDLSVDPDKVANVVKILRRSAQPDKLNVGMTVFPGNPVDPEDETKVLVTFQKSREKKGSRKADATGTQG